MLRDFDAPFDRLGSKPRMASDHPDVSFRQLRTMRLRTLCEVCANSRPEHVQQTTKLFDHLVGAGEQRRWHVEAERFSGFEVDNKLEFGWRLDR
jgi:hypothetical protein